MALAGVLAAGLGWEGTGYVLEGMSLLSPWHEWCWFQLHHADTFKGLIARWVPDRHPWAPMSGRPFCSTSHNSDALPMSFMLFVPPESPLYCGIKIHCGGQFLGTRDLELGQPSKLHRALGGEITKLVLLWGWSTGTPKP